MSKSSRRVIRASRGNVEVVKAAAGPLGTTTRIALGKWLSRRQFAHEWPRLSLAEQLQYPVDLRRVPAPK
jgi:hypothetical protein